MTGKERVKEAVQSRQEIADSKCAMWRLIDKHNQKRIRHLSYAVLFLVVYAVAITVALSVALSPQIAETVLEVSEATTAAFNDFTAEYSNHISTYQ